MTRVEVPKSSVIALLDTQRSMNLAIPLKKLKLQPSEIKVCLGPPSCLPASACCCLGASEASPCTACFHGSEVMYQCMGQPQGVG